MIKQISILLFLIILTFSFSYDVAQAAKDSNINVYTNSLSTQ